MFHKQEKIISHKYVHFVLSSLKFNLIVIVLYLIQKKNINIIQDIHFGKTCEPHMLVFMMGEISKNFCTVV